MTFRHIQHYVGAVYLAQAVAAVRSFINARFLGPGDYGFWGWLVFIVSFGYFLHLGTQEMMLKEVPSLKAQGKDNEALRLIQVNFTFCLMVLVAAGTLIALLGFLLPSAGSSVHRAGWIVAGVMMVVEVLYYFEQVVARSLGHFSQIGRTLFVTNMVSLGLTCWLVIRHRMLGIYAVAILTPLFGFWYMHRYTQYPLKIVVDIKTVLSRIQSGWPIVAMGLFFLVVSWVDRGIIMTYLGVTAHGYYTLGSTIAFMLFLFPKGLADIFEPKLHFHHVTDRPGQSIVANFLGPARFLAWIMPGVLLVGHLLLPWVIQSMLPDYEPGLLVMRILIWTSYLVGLMAMSKSSLVALNKQMYTVPAIIAAVIINAAVSLAMVSWGYGVAGVAIGSTTALTMIALWLVGLIIKDLHLSGREIAGYYLSIFGPVVLLGAPFIAGAWSESFTGRPGEAGFLWVQSAAVLLYIAAGISEILKWLAENDLRPALAETIEVTS